MLPSLDKICEREETCFHANRITKDCRMCVRYVENRFYMPCSAKDNFIRRKPLKNIVVSEEHIEKYLNDNDHSEEAYKEIVRHILEISHDGWIAGAYEFEKK
ncbi:MAG: hypothetical protein ACRC5M_00750 [Anaeroplasmataceae bacterium]